MNRSNAAAAYAALYAPTSEDLRRLLPEIGETLAAQLAELCRSPTIQRCDDLAINLTGAQAQVRKLREALAREGGAQ